MSKDGSLYHVAIAVKDIEKAEDIYSKLLGLQVVHREDVVNYGVKTSMLCSESGGGTAIELIEPLDENSPISEFLKKRGEGVHHICFLVDDVESSLRALEKEGVRLIDEHPRPGSYKCIFAFIHPKS
ncbi:MAG: methylmalonyl-CoA epimerase, partial [Candidatus Dadabacteria bacterium]|nr:methylmalonyl-CoA epimerase [Candidatus Dadabacteria bacterium]